MSTSGRTTRRAVIAALGALPALASARPRRSGQDLVDAARRQIGVTTGYDGRYRSIAYPWGDAPRSTGVCADVVVRAVRDAWGLDLQRLVHEDMARDFGAYPQRWGLPGPDSNIDHRRVPNLEAYFTRQRAALWRATTWTWTWGVGFSGELRPGDLLTWRSFPNGGPHIAIVSRGGSWPLVIQNHGWGVHENWLAQQWLDAANGHFRWLPIT
jgi:uncharacterized protein